MIQIIPTDTCYGLAGALTETDYLAIYRLKGRNFAKQLAFLVEDFDDMSKYIEISDEQIEFLRNYPYPWSFLGKRKPEFQLPKWMDSEKYSMISLRVASVCIPTIPLSHYPTIPPFPLFLTSANLSGDPESTTLTQAISYFPGVLGYDGGVCDRPPSDIFSIGADGELRYVRQNY